MTLDLSLLFPFFAYIGIGFAAHRLLPKSEEAQEWLDSFVFYVAMPALLFQLIVRAGLPSGRAFLLLGITSAVTISMFVLAAGVNRWRFDAKEPAVFGLLGAYSNIGYMGPIISVQLFGVGAGLPAALIFCSEIIVVLTLWSATTTRGGRSIRGIAGAVFQAVRHPFVLTVLLAFVTLGFGVSSYAPLDATLTGLQNAAAPCALFSLGITLSRQEFAPVTPGLSTSIAIKLIVHPLIVGLCLWQFRDQAPLWLGTAVLMAALPPAANVYVLARGAGRDVKSAANGVMFGTIASIVTVPVIILFLVAQLGS